MMEKRYHKLYDQCMKLSHENIQLIKDASMLKAQVNLLTIDSSNPEDKENKTPESGNVSRNMKDIERGLVEEKQKNLALGDRVANLWQAFTEEHAKSRELEHDLTENHKNIWMLSRGTKDLDQLLSIGQLPKVGYNGKESTATVFVHRKEPLQEHATITKDC